MGGKLSAEAVPSTLFFLLPPIFLKSSISSYLRDDVWHSRQDFGRQRAQDYASEILCNRKVDPAKLSDL